MSYIAFELDALNVCPQVGAACGLSAAEASHGLLQLWAWCFRMEQATVTDTHLRGFFMGRDAAKALEAFGFLALADAGWRVKGAERYLRVKEAQREGGRKGAKNLRRGTPKKPSPKQVQPKVEPGVDLRVDLGSTSGTTSSASPALTPSTEHRTPNTESEKKEPARSRVLSDRLVASFAELRGTAYKFAASIDGPALARLLKACADDGEIDRRWRAGLVNTKFPTVSTIAQLDQRWNDLSAGTGPPKAAERPEGRVRL